MSLVGRDGPDEVPDRYACMVDGAWTVIFDEEEPKACWVAIEGPAVEL